MILHEPSISVMIHCESKRYGINRAMLIELLSPDFYKARALFAPLMAEQMFCAGVLEGLYSGRVFVDDRDHPQSGLVTKDNVWWFLAGNPNNAAFNQALNTALFDRTIVGEKGWGGMLVCHPADWDAQMSVIFAPHIPIATQRLHYTCQQMTHDWRAQIPDGFEIRFLDQSLVDDGIALYGAAEDALKLRQDAAEPDRKAVGFVALHDQKMVAYSVVDCIVDKGGDIGLYTDGAFRRRNLAYLTSAAVIEYALAHGVEVVHWDCEAFNTGSIRTAEKLELKLRQEHTMYRLILNPLLHEVNRAWAYFDAGSYPQAAEICQQHIDAGSPHVHHYYVLARCYAETSRPDEAIRTLELAAKNGWTEVNEAKDDFSALKNHPLWDGILEQMQKNADAKKQ